MQITFVVTGIIIATFIILFLRARARMNNIPLAAHNEKILTLTDKNFQYQTKNKVILVDF
jgi:thioredoxin 1